MFYKTIEEIREAYNNGEYTYKASIPSKVSANHVFNETLSVKANREMAEEHNAMVAKMQKEKMEKNAELAKKLAEDVVDYIVNTYNLTKTQAQMVERYVYVEKHSFMCDYFANIDSVAEFAENLTMAK